MTYVYTHLPQDEDIGPEGRSYSVTEETLEYQGRTILYLYVVASDISFCDRNYAPHIANVNVKGYVVRWKHGTDEEGEPMSEVEPIRGDDQRKAITSLLRATYNTSAINFS
ncbi:MAG: hypothetical protein V3S51_01095 [Dehalococcoidia bacterium]